MIGLFCKRAPFSVCKYEDMRFGHQIDRKNPPPRGGFLFTMFPDQEPGGKGSPSKKLENENLMREPKKIGNPPGERGFFRSM